MEKCYTFILLIEFISNLMPATGLKNLAQGQQRAEKEDILKRFSWENI